MKLNNIKKSIYIDVWNDCSVNSRSCLEVTVDSHIYMNLWNNMFHNMIALHLMLIED